MPKTVDRVFSREFKLAALRRMLAGENVTALARELKVRRKLLYAWRDRFRSGGPEALRTRGRPRKVVGLVAAAAGAPAAAVAASDNLEKARRQIAALERKVGQQQLELDFFRQALLQVEGKRRTSDGRGATASKRTTKC